MAYQATTFDGIVVDSRGIAWVEGTHVKVMHVAGLADNETIDFVKIMKSFRTGNDTPEKSTRLYDHTPILDKCQIHSALAYFEKHKAICKKQIDDGEAEPVFVLTSSRRSKNGAYYGLSTRGKSTPSGETRWRLLQGSRLRQDNEPLQSEKIDEDKCQFRDDPYPAFLLCDDLPLMSKRRITDLVCGYPNCGSSEKGPKWEQLWPADFRIANFPVPLEV